MADSATIEAGTGLRTSSDSPSGTLRGLPLRVRTRLRRPWLDREIARGAERPRDSALALREAQLSDRRERQRLARRLEEILAAKPRRRGPSSAVPIDHRAVEVARPILTELTLSLRSSAPVEARGVVLGWRLLTDATSPIYAPPDGRPGSADGLWWESQVVLFALRPLAVATQRMPAGIN